MISRPQRLRLVRAVLAGDPDPPVWSGGPAVATLKAPATHFKPTSSQGPSIGTQLADEEPSSANANPRFRWPMGRIMESIASREEYR